MPVMSMVGKKRTGTQACIPVLFLACYGKVSGAGEIFHERVDGFTGFCGDHVVKDLDAVTLSLDDPLVLEQGKMLGNSRLWKLKALPDLFHVARLGHEPGHDLQPHRVAKDFQDFRFAIEVDRLVKFDIGHVMPSKNN